MRVKHHYFFRMDSPFEEILNLLEKFEIPYDTDKTIDGNICAFSFDIYEDDSGWLEFKKKISELINITGEPVFPISSNIFDDSELADAQWLSVRSMFNKLYLYNKEQSCQLTYCDCQQIQINEFRLKEVIKWGRNHIFSPFNAQDELFVDDYAKNILSMSDLKGYEYWKVKKSFTNVYIPNVYQLKTSCYLPMNSVVVQRDDIEDNDVCPKCGRHRYIVKFLYVLKIKKDRLIDIPCDILRTSDTFGYGFGQSYLLITNRFYQILKENNLTRNLEIQPVKLI